MKKLMFLAVASVMMFACSNDDVSTAPETVGGLTFELSAVNKLSDGINSRAPIYSQEATQAVTRVNVHAFKNDGTDYLYVKSFNIAGWTSGLAFKRFVVANEDKLAAGDYKFLAVGQDATDLFTITPLVANTTNFNDVMATITASGNESEIFAGSATTPVLEQGTRVSIEMTRMVAGVLGYFKNVPQDFDGKTVKYLRLTASSANKQVNLSNGIGIDGPVASYNIIDMDLSGQTVTDGIFTGNDLSAQGVVKVANSQLGGAFFMPVSNITLTLGVYDDSGVAIRTWVVKDNTSTTFNILANHFYSLGQKVQAGNTNGGTGGDPGDDDNPIDLLADQTINITITPAWDLIHNLQLQPNP